MNSRDKGKRGERQFAQWLRDQGFSAHRGQQFSGGEDSPDVKSELPYHIEVKFVERLDLYGAMAQAEGDAKGKAWFVAHRRKNGRWCITTQAETFIDLYRRSKDAEKDGEQQQTTGDANDTNM